MIKYIGRRDIFCQALGLEIMNLLKTPLEGLKNSVRSPAF